MIDHTQLSHNKTAEELVQILCKKTQSDNPLFFRILVAFYLTKVASMMRCSIETPDRGEIPVNMYGISLATSGFGKGFSMGIIEDQVINQFRERFNEETLPFVSSRNLAIIATKRALRKSTDPADELVRMEKEYDDAGAMPFSFDSGTAPAFKQVRHKCLLADAGAMNFICDEIGSNLFDIADLLKVYLEAYDKGTIKQKLTKSSMENKRNEEIKGGVPTNMLLFGTPSKLLDGGKTEDEFTSVLDTGFARRSFFCYVRSIIKDNDLTVKEIFDRMTDTSSNQFLIDISNQLGMLADASNFNRKLTIAEPTYLKLLQYKLDCEKLACTYPEHQEIRKAELSHRYFKALKLAGTYAFIEGSFDIQEEHIMSAIKVTEESGIDFEAILNRERPYVKLAKYLASVEEPVTQVDLTEDLIYYKGGAHQKAEMLTYAIAWGHKHNIIIKKSWDNGIEFMQGESLKETDLSKMIVAYSSKWTEGFKAQLCPFDQLHNLCTMENRHWTNHHLIDGYREENKCIPGFNMLVLDCDGSVSIETVKMLMEKYKFLLYTTKRHQLLEEDGTKHGDRFRLILPLKFALKMDKKEYNEFMNNVFEWLPFTVDNQTGQRAKKWMTHMGHHEYHDGELLDPVPFIPKTSKNEERKKEMLSAQSLPKLERWFLMNTGDGNRSNNMLRYGYILLDMGQTPLEIQPKLEELNDKLADKLSVDEIQNTMMVTLSKAYALKLQGS
ncbi:MAG: DUF3987 domain-containing protein [Pseudoalteromonas sp.]|uniref:hypothetical protein n=1 Tax=Pseudoalteromonas sp. TaxID=53249 RepID=UPI001DF9974B|nr:hypothetical protein [Pseudoalteromonas sp.]NRA77148.1 DUF3987 domain-containing protein [Pseudoalteromonas sp.]